MADAEVLALPAEVTMGRAPALVAEVDAAVARSSGGLRIDASALAELDTSAIALLLHASRAARAKALQLEVSGTPPKLRELARLYGVLELLPLKAGLEG